MYIYLKYMHTSYSVLPILDSNHIVLFNCVEEGPTPVLLFLVPNDGPGSSDSTGACESRLTSCSVLRALEVLFQFLSFLGKKAMGKIEGVRFTCIGTGLICLNIILNLSCLSWGMLKVVPHQLSICMRLYVF